MKAQRLSIPAASLAAFVFASLPLHAQHQGDVWIGRSSDATGRQLKVAVAIGGCVPFDPRGNLGGLTPTSGCFEGWSGDSPGFDAIRTESPANDSYVLAPGADIWLDIVSIDPAFVVVVPPNYDILDSPGQSARLGNYQLHKHLIWLIDSTSPAFDPTQCTWRVTFRLRDAGSTGYATSVPFTIRFATSNVSPADFDCDGDVDLADFGRFQSCFNGPNRALRSADCGNTDLDMDTDVDLADFLVFQTCFNGPNRSPKSS